jgi:hypothetical protein
MHLSARSELKTELSESRIETKVRINKYGLLPVCLTGASCSHADALKCWSCTNGRHVAPVHMIKLTEAREITPYRWVHPDEER